MLMRTKIFLHSLYNRFIRIKGTPEQLAYGVAIGFFVAMTPTMGFQTFIVIPLASLLGINKVTSAMAVWITNPITAPFIYSFNYLLGAVLLGYPLKLDAFSNPSPEMFFSAGKQVLIALTVGGIVTGIMTGVAGYFATLGIINSAKKTNKAIHRLKKR